MLQIGGHKNETEKLMDVRKKSLSPNKKSNSEPALKELLRRLEKDQVSTLRKALESRGHNQTSCITYKLQSDNSNQTHINSSVDLGIIQSARRLSFTSLRCDSNDPTTESELIRLPWCHERNCINPYHFSYFIPQFISKYDQKYDKYDNIESNPHLLKPAVCTWAVCMFWDGKKRIGRSFPINSDYFSVFGSLLEEDGMCLQSFTNLSEDCLKTVNQLECGITMWRSETNFWLYNRDNNSSVFAHSTTLSSDPIKIMPGNCISLSSECKNLTISFVKGWGRSYRRHEVTDCPAWLEILL